MLFASQAQAADPQALFDKGVADMEAGRFETACPAIEESYTLDPRPGTLFTLAECESKRGRIATALRHYDDYLAAYGALNRDQRAKQGDRERICRAQQEALAAKVPELTLVLPPNAPPGTEVTRDGVLLDKLDLGIPKRVDPGEHVIVTRAPGHPPSTARTTLAIGERKGIALVVLEPAPEVPAATPKLNEAPAAQGTSWRLGVGIAGVGVGAALLATGIVSTVEVLGVNNDPNFVKYKMLNASSFDVCATAQTDHVNTGLAASVISLCSKLSTFEKLEGVAYTSAAVFTGLGLYFLLTARPPATQPATSLVVAPRVGPGLAGASAALHF
jgi:tetratricopeptide (TPR) repeat protein